MYTRIRTALLTLCPSIISIIVGNGVRVQSPPPDPLSQSVKPIPLVLWKPRELGLTVRKRCLAKAGLRAACDGRRVVRRQRAPDPELTRRWRHEFTSHRSTWARLVGHRVGSQLCLIEGVDGGAPRYRTRSQGWAGFQLRRGGGSIQPLARPPLIRKRAQLSPPAPPQILPRLTPGPRRRTGPKFGGKK